MLVYEGVKSGFINDVDLNLITDKILNIDSDTEEGVNLLNQKIDMMDVELKVIKNELALSREENLMLHEKLDEILKE